MYFRVLRSFILPGAAAAPARFIAGTAGISMYSGHSGAKPQGVSLRSPLSAKQSDGCGHGSARSALHSSASGIAERMIPYHPIIPRLLFPVQSYSPKCSHCPDASGRRSLCAVTAGTYRPIPCVFFFPSVGCSAAPVSFYQMKYESISLILLFYRD